MLYLKIYIVIFLAIGVIAVIKEDWTVWIIALFAALYFADKLGRD